MNILITTAEWKSALTCMRSLAKDGHKISLISSDQHTPSLYSKFCSEKIISPYENRKEEYLKFILSLIRKNRFDLLIPISDLCNEYFSDIQDALSKYVKILLPSKEAMEITRNKDKTYRFAYENNIPIPKTYFLNNLAEVEILAKEICFPCVIKESKGTGGSGNTYVNNKEELTLFFGNLSKNPKNWPVVQEFVQGRSCGFTAVCNKGNIVNFFMFELLRQFPKKGGITVYARSIFDVKAFEASKDLVKKLLWTGPIDLDFFIVKNRGPLLLEINPRFSGTIQFAYSCGVDLPLKYLELILGRKSIAKQKKYKTGVYYRNVFPEEIKSCIENKKYIPGFFINFLNPNMRYDFSLADHNLLLWQLRNIKWEFLDKIKL